MHKRQWDESCGGPLKHGHGYGIWIWDMNMI